MNTCILLSSPEKPIVAFRERILNRRHTLVQDLFTKVKDRHFWLSWFDPGDPALGKRWKVVITFHPTTSKQYKLYRVLLYNLYIVFPIYGISTCVPGHINVRGKWFHLAQTSAKDARTAQMRPQDVSKHVPTCADILYGTTYSDYALVWVSTPPFSRRYFYHTLKKNRKFRKKKLKVRKFVLRETLEKRLMQHAYDASKPHQSLELYMPSTIVALYFVSLEATKCL